MVPVARLLLEPLLRTRDTVPEVVGFQFKVTDWPAVAEMPPLGLLKGFAVLVD